MKEILELPIYVDNQFGWFLCVWEVNSIAFMDQNLNQKLCSTIIQIFNAIFSEQNQ